MYGKINENCTYLKFADKTPLPWELSAGREALHLELKLQTQLVG